jgi:Holliday junction DNA helicase RuvA
MIASIKGEVIAKSDSDLTIQVGGIGVKVLAPKLTCLSSQLGEFVSLSTTLVVREDSLTLFGFENKEQRDFFNLLFSVSGVGTKAALSIISTLSVETIVNSIVSNQEDVFRQVPGIGRKSAQKIILFMRDKVKHLVTQNQFAGVKDINSDVLNALINLGYSVVEAQSAIQSIPKDEPEDIESRLRIALQYFST